MLCTKFEEGQSTDCLVQILIKLCTANLVIGLICPSAHPHNIRVFMCMLIE